MENYERENHNLYTRNVENLYTRNVEKRENHNMENYTLLKYGKQYENRSLYI